MKKVLINLFFAIALLFSTPVNSFYNSNNLPMIKMMSVMIELMSQMMLGGSGSSPFAMSTLPLAMSGLPMSGLPMSPTSQLGSLYNVAGSNSKNPWMNNSSQLQQNSFTPDLSNSNLNNNSLNGIWQALSGDIMAIYFNSNFIWTDGKERHLVGSLVIKGSQFSAYIPTKNKVINFQFYRQNNKFAVKDSNNKIHVFSRIH